MMFFEERSSNEKLAAEFDESPYAMSIDQMTGKLAIALGDVFNNLNPLDSKAFQEIEGYSNSIQQAFGMSKDRMNEFKTSIADAAPALVKLGLSESDVSNNLISIMNSLGGAASLSKEAVVELSQATLLTGENVGTLAQNFRDVGISVYDAGDEMKKVAEVARAAGVSVNEVSSKVMNNLEKMNLYNFENGVQGLAKMSAQAVRLGLDMQNVFLQMEKAFNPEGAIEISASLQRLGVTTSGLLDPLRAMDMASNDPEQFQKEIVNLGKEFTRFNEKTGQMEILPGAKRRMREVAVAVGLTGEEFSKMALKSADFDMKLKQIKMPSFGVEDEETKEMIATMAQMKDGVATIQVKDDKTGEQITKSVDQLTPEDIENLKKSTEDSSKSLEELAIDQLSVLKQIDNNIKSGITGAKMGKASDPQLLKLYDTVAGTKLELAKGFGGLFSSTEDNRKALSSITKPVEGLIVAGITGDDKSLEENAKKLQSNFLEQFNSIQTNFISTIDKVQSGIGDQLKNAYGKSTTVETKSSTTAEVNLNLKSDGSLNDAQLAMIKQKMIDDPEFRKKFFDGPLISASTGGKNK